MNAKSFLNLALFSAILIGFARSSIADGQQLKDHRKVFTGPEDLEFPSPAKEGKIGQRDAAALAEIKHSVDSNLVLEHIGLEVRGTLTNGSGDNQQHYPASISIENGRRFRFDVDKEDGIRTLRIHGDNGKAKQSNKATQELEDIEFVNPLALPSLLYEVVARKDAVVVDDGVFTVNDHSMNKVTITLSRTHFGIPVSASFYFDSETHLLEKGVFVEHSQGNRSLKYLKVVTYGDYRKDQSMLLPHTYTETINGQLVMILKVASISLTSSHEDSYFSF